jgi:uncharacterized protein (TIGR03435 family)
MYMTLMKLKQSATLLLAVPVLLAQSTSAPAWKEFSIGPATRNQSGFSRDGIRAEGIPLKRALARAWGLPEHRIIGPEWLADQRYAMTALVNDPQDLPPLLREELTRRFKMVAQVEAREMPVYVLTALDGQPSQQTPAPAASGGRGPQIKGGPMTMTAFAETLSDAIQRPVIDETHLPGTFHFDLSWKSTDFASMRKAVNEQLGLQLAEEKRNIQVLVIDHIEPLAAN